MVVSIVLSYFAAQRRKMNEKKNGLLRYLQGPESRKTSRTVLTCLIMMNIDLFMAVIAGCMELLYRPLTSSSQRLHSVECAIAMFNIITCIIIDTVIAGQSATKETVTVLNKLLRDSVFLYGFVGCI